MAAKRARTLKITDVDANGKVTTPAAPTIAITAPVVVKTGAPGYFSRVVSNVKGRAIDVKLGACTAVVSERNRAGKTAVLDAFRLALTGKHPIGSDAVDLIGLTADGSFPKAGLSGDVSSVIFEFPEGKRTPVRTVNGEFMSLSDDAGNLLPLVANRELLTLGTAKAREGLFRRFGNPDLATGTSVPVGMSPEQSALWTEALKGDGRLGALDTVERLAAAGTWIRSHKKTLSGQVKALDEEKQRLHDMAVAAGAGAPTDDILHAVQKKIDVHKALANTGIMRSRAQVSESRLTELIAVFQSTPKPMEEAAFNQARLHIVENFPMEALNAAIGSKQPALDTAERNVRLFTMMLGLRQHFNDSGTCLVCLNNATVGGARQLVADATTSLAEAKAQAEQLSSGLEEDRRRLRDVSTERNEAFQQLEGERARQQNTYHRLVSELKSAKESYLAAQEMLKEAGVAEVPEEPLEVLQQQLQALQNSKAEGNRASQLAVELRKLAAAQEDTKTVEKALGTRLNELVATVRTAAQTAVNAWMPTGFTAALMLEDEDGKPACRWEIVGADGRPHPRGAASGAEWAALSVAIACAWSDGQKFRFLLLDDADLAGFSAENVRNTLTMVAKAVADGKLTQALVAWSRPNEIPDEGWSVVTL